MRAVFGAAAMLSTLAILAACSSPPPAPETDEEKARALYSDVQDAVRNRDAVALIALACPHLRESIEPEIWFEHEIPGEILSIKYITNPTGGPGIRIPDSIYSPEVETWIRLYLTPPNRPASPEPSQNPWVNVGKVGGGWYLCET